MYIIVNMKSASNGGKHDNTGNQVKMFLGSMQASRHKTSTQEWSRLLNHLRYCCHALANSTHQACVLEAPPTAMFHCPTPIR